MYKLATDWDGNWYVIPVEKDAEFDALLDARGDDFPEWAEAVNSGPRSVKFYGYTVE